MKKGIFMRLKGWYLLHEGRYEEARALLTQAREFFENRDGGSGQYAMNIAACYNYIGDVWQGNERVSICTFLL